MENRVTRVYLLQAEGFGEEVTSIDDLLAERFRFLSRVQVQSEEQVQFFPRLNARGVEITSLL